MELSTRSIKFIWKLENFCFCDFYCNARLSSPRFTLNAPIPSQWSLYMFPNGYGIEKYVGIFLKRSKKDSGPKEIKVRFRISLVGRRGELYPESHFMDKIFCKGCEWGHNEFIKRSEIHPGSLFLSQDTLTVLCELCIEPNTSDGIYCRRVSCQSEITNEVDNICKGMKSLYENKKYSDTVTLQGKNKSFTIHKCILKSRLPGLFRTLRSCPDRIFKNDFATEKILLYGYTGKLDFKDIDSIGIKRILSEYGLDSLQNAIMSHPAEYLATTYFSVRKNSFHWEISVSSLINETEKTSSLIADDQIGFVVTLNKYEDNIWKIFIKVICSDDIFVRCIISVSNHDSYKELEHFFGCNEHWEYDLQLQLMGNFLVFDDDLVPICNDFFSIDFIFIYATGSMHSNLEETSSWSESSVSCVVNDLVKLLTDMEELYYTGDEADITIKAGGKDFRVHRCILAARSPVFQAMLEHDMKEKNENEIPIEDDQILDEDLLAQVVDKFLLYIYCGKFEASSPEMEALLNSKIDMYLIGEHYEAIDAT